MLGLIKGAFEGFKRDEVPQLAAALSYYTVFSLAPLLILVTIVAGLVLDPADVQGRMVREIGGVIGPEGARQIRTMIEQVERPGSGGALVTTLSALGLLLGATGAFNQLKRALNTVWNVPKGAGKGGVAGLVLSRLLSFGMVLIVAFLLLVSLVVTAVIASAGDAIAAQLPAQIGKGVLQVAGLGLSLLVITPLFMAMYRILPDVEIAWRDVWRGALITAVLFLAGKFLLGFYVARSDPGSAFGAAGSLALILVWIYYSAMIFLLGAELTQVYADRRGRGIRPDYRESSVAG